MPAAFLALPGVRSAAKSGRTPATQKRLFSDRGGSWNPEQAREKKSSSTGIPPHFFSWPALFPSLTPPNSALVPWQDCTPQPRHLERVRKGSLLRGPPQRGLQGQILNRSCLQQHSEQTPMVEGNCNFRERYVSEMISSGNIRSYLWQELIWARLSQELWRNNHRSRAGLLLTRMAVGAPPSPRTSTSLPPALRSWPGSLPTGSQQRGQPLGKGSLGT